MRPWTERPVEEAALLNPAFCATVLTTALDGYVEHAPSGMSFPLAFLVLPLVLHKQTREALPSTVRTSMAAWIESHSEARIGLAERVRALAPFTREALLFGSTHRVLGFSESGRLAVLGDLSGVRKYSRTTSAETRACIEKGLFVGRWFAAAGSEQTILSLWGVRP